MYREKEIFITRPERHHDGPPSSPDCRKVYDQRHTPIEDYIEQLVKENDMDGILHLLTCLDCRLAIQTRERDSSESLMDIQLNEAILQCAPRAGKR